AASRPPKRIVARGPSLIPLPIVRTSPASPRRVEAVHRRNAGIRRAHACIVHVGRLSRTFPVSLIGRPSCRPGVQIVVLGAKGSIGGAVVRRARFAGQQVRAVVRPSSGQDRFPAGGEVVHAAWQSKESVGAGACKPCRWPLHADAPHEFILIDDAAEALLQLVNTPAAHGQAVHVPGPNPITPRAFVRLVYAAAGAHEPTIRVFGRVTFRFFGLFNRLARSAYEMAYLFDDPVLLDGSLYRSVTGGPHPATPYEEGI